MRKCKRNNSGALEFVDGNGYCICMSVWHLFCPKAKLKFIMLCWATTVLQGRSVFKATDDMTERAESEFGKPLAHSLENGQI